MDTRTVFGRQLSYQYDLRGRRARLTHPDGFYVTYGYSNADELLTLTDSTGTTVATYGYDGLGTRTSLTRPNGASTVYVPDAAGRLQELRQDLSGTGLDLTETFAYNPAGRISSKTVSNDAAYTFVPSPLNSTTTAQFDGQNQLTSFAGSAITDDANGNVWTGLGSLAYTYDALGQLRQTSGGALVDYDPTGMLRRVQVGGTVKEYLYDGADLIAEYNGSAATPLRRFVHGASHDEPLVIYEGSGTANKSWLHADERGSIIAASNASGVAASGVKYSVDGDSGALASSFGYTGQLYLPDLQLYYYKARMYSAKAGRFLQPDPIGYADGMNRYSYVGNDPVNLTDPSGLCEDEIAWLTGQRWNPQTQTLTATRATFCFDDLPDLIPPASSGSIDSSGSSPLSAPTTQPCTGAPPVTDSDRRGLMSIGEWARRDDIMEDLNRLNSHINGAAWLFGVDPQLVKAIVFEEQSHLLPFEAAAEALGRGSTVGLGQVTVGLYGFTRRQLLDPRINAIAMAYHISVVWHSGQVPSLL